MCAIGSAWGRSSCVWSMGAQAVLQVLSFLYSFVLKSVYKFVYMYECVCVCVCVSDITTPQELARVGGVAQFFSNG